MLAMRKRRQPIPWSVTCAMVFIDENLPPSDWEREVRKIIRTRMPSIMDEMEANSLIDVYDDRIAMMIEEELARN